ncbi:MAG: hypothetical protein IT164_20005 [Bryobacterales bacterium]|nr:hypothetical protein [Bryobacterales bacterium]
MTKIQIEYDLLRPLDAVLLERIAGIHGVYGMTRVQPGETPGRLSVEYDASRLTEPQVEHNLHRYGIPVQRPHS